jgi:RNA polymerase sigma-70 factor, ECF subfamily
MKPRKHSSIADELELIRKAQAGDDRAFTKLVRQYENLVYSFAFKVCRDKEKAEETWQDTFVNVYRKLHQFDGKAKFSTWLYSIVANNCRMKRRKTKLDLASVFLNEPHEDAPDQSGSTEHAPQTVVAWRETPLEKMMNAELKSRLDTAIQKLPYDYRVVFVLRDVEGQSAEETGKILKLTVPAVKSRLRRARVFLREQLNEYMTA